jgi:hypothetical protein
MNSYSDTEHVVFPKTHQVLIIWTAFTERFSEKKILIFEGISRPLLLSQECVKTHEKKNPL